MGWKIYFWILIIIGLLTYPFYGLSRMWEVGDLVVYAISVTGVYGFAWKRKIASDKFWKAFFLIHVSWNVYYSYFVSLPQKVAEIDMGGMPHATMATINWIPFIPLLIALYFYGYKSEEVWKNND